MKVTTVDKINFIRIEWIDGEYYVKVSRETGMEELSYLQHNLNEYGICSIR